MGWGGWVGVKPLIFRANSRISITCRYLNWSFPSNNMYIFISHESNVALTYNEIRLSLWKLFVNFFTFFILTLAMLFVFTPNVSLVIGEIHHNTITVSTDRWRSCVIAVHFKTVVYFWTCCQNNNGLFKLFFFSNY